MPDISTPLPWAVAAVLYVEQGWSWLKLVLLTNPTNFAPNFLDAIRGKGEAGAVVAARLVAASVILGWPAYQAFGWINARLSNGGPQ